MSLQKGHFEYVGHGVTWVPDEEPDIKTIPTHIEITEKLEQKLKYYWTRFWMTLVEEAGCQRGRPTS